MLYDYEAGYRGFLVLSLFSLCAGKLRWEGKKKKKLGTPFTPPPTSPNNTRFTPPLL
jgi:hypothetical protein